MLSLIGMAVTAAFGKTNKIDTIPYNLQSNDWFINILCNLISIGLGYSFVI